MISDPQAVRSYAEALFAAAKEQGVVAQLLDEAKAFMEAIAQVPQFRHVMTAPNVPTEDKMELARRVLGDRFHPLLRNFILLLLKRGRPAIFRAAITEFKNLAERDQGVSRGRLLSAAPLDEAQREEVRRALEQETGLKLVIDYETDAELLGGLVFKCGDLLIDNSLKSSLGRMREQLLAVRIQ